MAPPVFLLEVNFLTWSLSSCPFLGQMGRVVWGDEWRESGLPRAVVSGTEARPWKVHGGAGGVLDLGGHHVFC